MEKVWIKEETLTAIGDAVRAKTGTSGLLAPDEMITALDGVKSSGTYLFSKKETSDGDVVGYAVADDLAKHPDGSWKDGYYWELVSKIEFKIRNNNGNYVTFYAAEGMTWAEFVDSEYNTQGIYIAGTSVLYGNEIRTSSGVSVTPTDIIMNDGSYDAMGGGSN